LASKVVAFPGAAPVRAADAPEVLALFHEHLALVDGIAGTLARKLGTRVERDDLVAAGREGLLDAARRFDASRSVPFGAYATYRIRGAIIDWVRKSVAVPRRAHERLLALEAASEINEGEAGYAFRERTLPPSAAAAEEHLADHLAAIAAAATLSVVARGERNVRELPEAAESDTPEEAYARAEFFAYVKGVIEGLPEEAGTIVRRHYLDGERLEDIARDLSVSKSWVSRLLTRTTARLARRLRSEA
jgi:RNA polymerase sigma factor for flagellar operon FliA